jgi:hypothetical protein
VSKRITGQGRLIAVLSDGLGSGIKANILACLTATMLLRFVEEEREIGEAAEIVLNSLPVCRVRRISYATFSAVEADEEGHVRVVEEGNPDFLWLRGDQLRKSGYNVVISKSFPDRRMKVYQFQVNLGDRLIFCSDGVTQAGLGRPGRWHSGLQREGLVEMLRLVLKNRPDISSSDLARYIVRRAQAVDWDGLARDDISAAVIYFRTPRQAMVFTGAPFDESRDALYARVLERFEGRKAICGGTTAQLLSRELGRPLTMREYPSGGNLPPISEMPGIDLITEGAVTLSRTLEYLERNEKEGPGRDGRLMEFFLKSDVIHFMVGSRLNPANYDPAQPLELDIRRNIINRLAEVLQSKYLKKIIVRHF